MGGRDVRRAPRADPVAQVVVAPPLDEVALHGRQAHLVNAGGLRLGHPTLDRPHDAFAQILGVSFHTLSLPPGQSFHKPL